MEQESHDGDLRAVTLRDVARQAGVDVSTASRALTGRRRVTADLSARVHSAAAALDYSPNQAARSLRLARSMTLGVVFRQFRDPGLLEFLEGLDTGADRRGYSLMLTVARGDDEHYRTLVRRLLERRVDGLFVSSPPDLEDALRLSARAGTQVVALFSRGAYGACGDELPLVTANEHDAILAAVERLAALGHRRLLHLGTPEAVFSIRMEWLNDAVRRTGIALAAEVIPYDEPPSSLTARLQQVLSRPDRPTALFIQYNMTPRLLHAVGTLGLSIPRDASLVVFGESTWTLEFGPALASIRHDMRTMGEITASAMADRLDGHAAPAVLDTGLAEWVERASVGPAPRSP